MSEVKEQNVRTASSLAMIQNKPISTTFAAFTNQFALKMSDKRPVKHRVKKVAPERPTRSAVQETIIPKREPPKLSMAPFPWLPSKREILLLIEETNIKLDKYTRMLNELERARKSDLMEISPIESLDPGLEVQDHIGMLVSYKIISKIAEENRKSIQRSRERVAMATRSKYSHTDHLPYLISNVQEGRELLDPMLRTVYTSRCIADEKAKSLAREYAERRALWEQMSKALATYHRESRELLEEWPPEIAGQRPKTKDNATLMKYVAVDEPMYLDDIEFNSFAYYNMNGFVEDPVRAHIEYKKRLVWTETEKQIFLDKYRLHPREFRKIAAGLPQKSVKDVIEYYYVHRIDLNLKGIEQQSKKRGRKKVITEGAVRK